MNSIDPFGLWKEVAPGVWEWEEGDTWKSLSQETGISKKALKKAFKGAELGPGLAPVDVNGLSPGSSVESYADAQITPLFRGVGIEMNRRVDASMTALYIVGAVNLAPAAIASITPSGGGITALGGVAQGTAATETVVVSQATRLAFQRQLAQHGKAALERSLRSLERRLAEHLAKLEGYRKAGGYTSSVEREIKNLQGVDSSHQGHTRRQITMRIRKLLEDPEIVKKLADTLAKCPQVHALDDGDEKEAWTLAHSFSDIEESCHAFLGAQLPRLLDDGLEASEVRELLLEIGEELRHVLYHINDPKFYRYLQHESK